MAGCLAVGTGESEALAGLGQHEVVMADKQVTVPRLLHERSGRYSLESPKFPGRLLPPQNKLFSFLRQHAEFEDSLPNVPSLDCIQASSLIVLSSDNSRLCTVTMLGAAAGAGEHSGTFSSAAYAASIAVLSSQPEVCFSHVSDEQACSVAITFPMSLLSQIPLLSSALETEKARTRLDVPQVQLTVAEGAPVSVWALVDLLACVISCGSQACPGVNRHVCELCRQCMHGVRPHALADLILVSYMMSCDVVFENAAEVAASEAGRAMAAYDMVPGSTSADPYCSLPDVLTQVNHWKVLKAICDKRAPLFVEHILTAAHGHDVSDQHACIALMATALCARSLLRLDLNTSLSLDQWLCLTHVLHTMPLEHLAVQLPQASARRSRSIVFERKKHKLWRSGECARNPLCNEDVSALAEAAAAGGLRRLTHLEVVNSSLDAPCMAPLGTLLAALAPRLIALNLHNSLRFYKMTESGCCDALVCDALKPLQCLQAICVTSVMMPGLQTRGAAVGMQNLVPWAELPEMQVVLYSTDAVGAVEPGSSQTWRWAGMLGMRLGETAAEYQERLLKEVSGVVVSDTPLGCDAGLLGAQQPVFLRVMHQWWGMG